MLYLHVSNRTENLLSHLVEVFRVAKRRNLFDKELFLIQSQGMERLISQTLAAHFTSWCNFEYYLPLGFLQYSAGKLGMEITPDGYERKVMVWRIEELLREIGGEDYLQVRRYLQGENVALKRYQLADQLANIFDQYQMMRPEMLTAWENNRRITAENTEIWQKDLWRRLSLQQEGAPHRGRVLQQVIARLQTGENFGDLLPERISVFGLSIMPPLFLQYLQGLALHSDVHLYVLSPCCEYWGDIERRRTFFQQSLTSQAPDQHIDSPENHPLLVTLGQQGRDFQRMLFADGVRFELEFTSYEDPLKTAGNDLLRKLQSDLLAGEVVPVDRQWPEDDHSIRIVSCHSKLREITILKEHILQGLYDNPELQLRDIVVMAPDIQEYAALIPAVFDTLQHSISDRSLRRRNRVLAAFADFLMLLRGRFGWDEMLDVLKEPAIAEKLQLRPADVDSVNEWVVASGIRWGLSGAQRKTMGLPEYSEGSWREGLNRLLMGYAIDSDEFVNGILPYPDIEGNGAAALGGVCQFVYLVEEALTDFSQNRTLTDWSTLLLNYSAELFAEESDAYGSKEFLELREILTSLAETPSIFHDSPVEFSVISAWLERTARETRSSSGFLRGQLTFCSMLPMRSIPFKMVCLIGLNDGVFPKNDQYATFDLMAIDRRPGDRSRRMDDRYQFLEALMAARERLYLSYIGQSIHNNEMIPPSVVVTELLELLERSYGANNIVVHHPLHPFSPRYFNKEKSQLFSFDDGYCQVAQKIVQSRESKSPWWSGKRLHEITEIDVGDLMRFYSNPQRWFVRDCLGVRLDTASEIVDESEIFTPTGLEKYLVNQHLLEKMLNEDDLKEALKKLQITGVWPLGEPGAISYQQKLTELSVFHQYIQNLELGQPCDELQVELEVAGYRLSGTLGNIYEKGILLYRYSTLRGKDLLIGWLHYLLYGRVQGRHTDVFMAGADDCRKYLAGCGNEPELETLVKLFVQGCQQPSRLHIEPAIAWVKKVAKGAPEEIALEVAKATLVRELEAGYDKETVLLLRDCELKSLLEGEFVDLSKKVVEPIWRRAYGH